jgi:hypothetical protein
VTKEDAEILQYRNRNLAKFRELKQQHIQKEKKSPHTLSPQTIRRRD